MDIPDYAEQLIQEFSDGWNSEILLEKYASWIFVKTCDEADLKLVCALLREKLGSLQHHAGWSVEQKSDCLYFLTTEAIFEKSSAVITFVIFRRFEGDLGLNGFEIDSETLRVNSANP